MFFRNKLEDLKDVMEDHQLESENIYELFNRNYTIDIDEPD